MRENNNVKTRYFKYIAIIVLVILLVAAGFFFLSLWEKKQGEYPEFNAGESYLEYDKKDYLLKKNIETFLVLGLDKFSTDASSDSYNNDKQSDFLTLLVFDNDAKTCSLLQINRDTMTEINVLGVAGNTVSKVTKQIALAHTYGNGKQVSCRNTSDAVSKLLLGAKINHYISITMDAVPLYNDLLGGVELTLQEDFTEIDEAFIKGETITLMGQQALEYVRTRYGLQDSTNSTRMERQKQYISAVYDKTLVTISKDEDFIVEATLKMADYIVSDRSVTQLQELLRKFSEYELVEANDIEGEYRMGEKFMEFYPNQMSVEKVVIDLFYQEKD